MVVGYRMYDFLYEIFKMLYTFGSNVYAFLSWEFSLNGVPFTLGELMFGPALITLLTFLIAKGLIK